MSKTLLAEETVALVERWLIEARAHETRSDRAAIAPLRGLIDDPSGASFTMRFVDRVSRPDDDRAASGQLTKIVFGTELPAFLSSLDRWLLRMGAVAGSIFPSVVMPLVRRRMRNLVGALVLDSEPDKFRRKVGALREQGFVQNLNLLGEAVLGERQANLRVRATLDLIAREDVDYVSIKLSSVVSQLNAWDWDGSLDRASDRLRSIYRAAAEKSPATFVNLDMEEYHDLELTMATFRRVLDEPEFSTLEAGIVLQAYLPDSFGALCELTQWAAARHAKHGCTIKIRLVKGANLAMEKVDAAIHGWEQAPFTTKQDVDANYKRCLDWIMCPEHMRALRIGVASHNLFDIAWAHLLSVERGVADRVEFEMLRGMAPTHARTVQSIGAGGDVILYTPIVAQADFDVAISYLFRRLDECSADGNFMRVAFSLEPETEAFRDEADRFRRSLAHRLTVSSNPRRSQMRPAESAHGTIDAAFSNEPDTDPVLAPNRAWARHVIAARCEPVRSPLVKTAKEIDRIVANARASNWSELPVNDRRETLHRVADAMARRRGDLINAMVHEGNKTFAEADPEISEAIDFARYYGDRAVELCGVADAVFESFGVMAVISPWNFPVAIPAGGIMASLAAGNSVLFKSSSETPRCGEIVAECAWSAGIPEDALQFIRAEENEVGRRLVTSVDGVILTGSIETATLFQSWKPDIRLFAETSGKNALVITPNADIDLAVADLVSSAFGHSGQKCSAASLAICVGSVYQSERFRRQLVDAVGSLEVGSPHDLTTMVGPTIYPVKGKLRQALTRLEPGEEWLVPPIQLDGEGSLWRPGVRMGVQEGSWFHRTECFGPVLGLMHAETLDDAINLQNASDYGLTGGIHTLDPEEAELWIERVEVGNAYVNRPISGAIVQRQPFGGWKRSSIGPGAKAGGPNYVAQLGIWRPAHAKDAALSSGLSDVYWWSREFSKSHDPSDLPSEANQFRYRRLDRIVIRFGQGATAEQLTRVESAAIRCGVAYEVSRVMEESDEEFALRLSDLGMAGVERIRLLGEASVEVRIAAQVAHIHLADAPVTANGRLELIHYLREQAVTRTLHRFGNLV